jgi:hypothetical protein
VAEELLDGPEIAARREELGREGVAEGVGRGRGGEAEGHARLRHRGRYRRAAEGAAADPEEERGVRAGGVGAEGAVALDRRAGDRQHRHLAGLRALADHADGLAEGRVALAEAERLGDAEPRAPEEGEHRRVAGRDPGGAVGRDGGEEVARVGLGHRAGQAGADLRGAEGEDRGAVHPLGPVEPGEEAADGGELAGERSGADAAPALGRHPGAEVADRERAEGGGAHPPAGVAAHEGEEAADRMAVGADRERACAPHRAELGEEAAGEVLGRGGEGRRLIRHALRRRRRGR